MVKIIGGILGIIVSIILLPFHLIGGIFSGLSRARNSEQNSKNGADIRALCVELGVPSESYNRIIINHMDRAKELAVKYGQPGKEHHDTPWNTRLAHAIYSIYVEELLASQRERLYKKLEEA